MFELDPAVRRETLRIALGTLVLSAVMEAVFLLLHKWDWTVLLGNLLGAFTAVFNFFLMCLTLTRCLSLEKDKAAVRVRTSQMGRLFMQAAFAGLGALLPCFNTVAVLVPLLFPSIVIAVIRLAEGRKTGGGTASGEAPQDGDEAPQAEERPDEQPEQPEQSEQPEQPE